MKLLFVDETDRQATTASRKFFCICGLLIDAENLIDITKKLEEIKNHYNLSNLKDARKSNLDEATRIEITSKIFDCLTKYKADVMGVVLGDTSLSYKLPLEDIYSGAMSFLLERYAIILKKQNTTGMVIFDTVDAIENKLRGKFFDHVQKEEVNMFGNKVCAIKDHVSPSLLFADDKHSVLIQAIDLIAVSLNSALVNTWEPKSPVSVENLPQSNKFLNIYWPLFARSPRNRVDGWGVKIWY
ncbi:MAG: DUF3800 domain-containing protein [Candidatus Pacebacteria bacterium]|nr:DUF3800 domain-containing protein [Candidatus Paceibacterota bacterium]